MKRKTCSNCTKEKKKVRQMRGQFLGCIEDFRKKRLVIWLQVFEFCFLFYCISMIFLMIFLNHCTHTHTHTLRSLTHNKLYSIKDINYNILTISILQTFVT